MNKLLNDPRDSQSDPVILIVEDSDEDFYTFIRALKSLDSVDLSKYSLLRFDHGDDTLDYLFRKGEYEDLQSPLPEIIILDLNLPGADGREIIELVKKDEELRVIPIIVLTTSENRQDVEVSYKKGTNSYLLKAMGTQKMQKTIEVLCNYWLNYSVLPKRA